MHIPFFASRGQQPMYSHSNRLPGMILKETTLSLVFNRWYKSKLIVFNAFWLFLLRRCKRYPSIGFDKEIWLFMFNAVIEHEDTHFVGWYRSGLQFWCFNMVHWQNLLLLESLISDHGYLLSPIHSDNSGLDCSSWYKLKVHWFNYSC